MRATTGAVFLAVFSVFGANAQHLPGLDVPLKGSLSAEPSAPSDEQLSLMPTQLGHRTRHVVFYASRKHKERKLMEQTHWDEVVESVLIHGFRVVFVRSSTGTLTRQDGNWVYGDPVSTVQESVYAVTSQGVALITAYSMGSGLEEEYQAKRTSLINVLADNPRADFIAELNNWIIPYPLSPGETREWPVSAGSYYKILRKGDKRFLTKSLRKDVVGVAGFVGGEWGVTRWVVAGKGVVLKEAHNNDDGVDREKFPFKLKALAVYADK